MQTSHLARLLTSAALFFSGAPVVSERERTIIIGGYVPMRMQEYNHEEVSPGLAEALPEWLRPLVLGTEKWAGRNSQFRRLDEARAAL